MMGINHLSLRCGENKYALFSEISKKNSSGNKINRAEEYQNTIIDGTILNNTDSLLHSSVGKTDGNDLHIYAQTHSCH